MTDPTGLDSELELHRWMGARIRQIRVTKNMTQDELAQRMGTQRPAVSNWENGINMPSLFTLRRMAATFGVSLRQLIEPDSEDVADVPMIPLDTAVDRPGLERWIRLYERLTELGDSGQRLLQTTLRIFGRLGALGDSGSGQVVYSSVLHAIQEALNFGLTVLSKDDARRTILFLRETGLVADTKADQDRFAHLHQVFVPPAGYVDLLARMTHERRVVVITGEPHQGKTFVATKLLADIAEHGYRPIALMGCFAGLAGDTARAEIRLGNCLRSGHAVLLDDPFSPDAGALALREFATNPNLALSLVAEADCRLIITATADALKQRPDVARQLAPYEWSLAEKYEPTSFVRMVINYSEIYHPGAREPIVASHEGLSSPHAVERSFAVATDNKQTIRRRSAGIRREGIEAITVADYETLDNAELAFLLLSRHVPLPAHELYSIFTRLDIRGIGGTVPAYDVLMDDLRRWLLVSKQGEATNIGFNHPSYASALDSILRERERVQRLAGLVLRELVTAGDPYLDRAAISLLSVISGAGAATLSGLLREAGLTDSVLLDKADRAVANLIRGAMGDQGEQLAAGLKGLCDTSFTKRYLSSFSLISAPAAGARSNSGSPEQMWNDMAKAYLSDNWQVNRDLLTVLASAVLSGNPRVRALAGTLAIVRGSQHDARFCARMIEPLQNDHQKGVTRCTKRALLDCFDLVPESARDQLLAATGL
ncbi:MAG TPA: helix-turn-helix transcriptional regulator [Candidatus Latescibacteria bacterium]|nr:helix-turn-helix transcriptional regulator [Candidatus Latescibacterota bacterium]